jgi:hypothetical protein
VRFGKVCSLRCVDNGVQTKVTVRKCHARVVERNKAVRRNEGDLPGTRPGAKGF